MRRSLLALALSCLVVPLAAPRPASTGAPPRFSRARWIEAHEKTSRFEGGALPWNSLPPASHRGPEALAAVKRAGGSAAANRRVSTDLLAPDGGVAQPETQAEPFLAIDPENERRLLAGFQENRFADGGARALGYGLSTDGGRGWGNGLIPNLTLATGGPWERASDPWVAFGPGHRAYFVSLAFDESRPDNAVVVSASEDGGASWGDPVPVHRAPDTNFDDKEAIIVDNRADSPYRGRVYVTWDMATEGADQPLLLAWSDDGGATWSDAVTVSLGVNVGVVPAVGPGGVLHLVWTGYFLQEHPQRALMLTSRSDDGGASWSEPVQIADNFAVGVRGMRVGDGLGALALDPRNGALYAAWEDSRYSPADPPLDQIVLSRSTDGGATWTPPQRVSDGPPDAASFTPAVAVDASGRVGVAYYSLRNDPERRFRVDEYFALSRNSGLTFTGSVRVSPASWDATFGAVSRGFFLGDYQGLVAGKRSFYPLFVATLARSRIDGNRPQPDVYNATLR